METHFILDTNAYRQIAETKDLSEIQATANELREKEKKLQAKSLMSVIVSMELLKHFDDTDPFFMTCFKAQTLQFFHTQSQNYGKPNNHIEFIPPINPLITQHFFKKNSEYLKYYLRVIEIAQNATKNIDTKDYLKDIGDIKIIAQQLIHERTEIKDNFEEFIKYVNNGVVDWEYFLNNKEIKEKLLKDIKSGRMLQLLAMSLLKRAHGVLDLEFMQPGLEKEFDDFMNFYEPLLKLNQSFFEKLLHGVIALADANSPKWNTHNDMQLLAAACFASYRERDKDVRIVIVTGDKAIHTACKDTYMQGNVWTLQEYLDYLN